MTPILVDHIVFVLLAAVFPIWDYFAIRKRAAQIRAGRTETIAETTLSGTPASHSVDLSIRVEGRSLSCANPSL